MQASHFFNIIYYDLCFLRVFYDFMYATHVQTSNLYYQEQLTKMTIQLNSITFKPQLGNKINFIECGEVKLCIMISLWLYFPHNECFVGYSNCTQKLYIHAV